MNRTIKRTVEEQVNYFLFGPLVAFMFLSGAFGCSVSLPDGKIACNGPEDCPKYWYCINNVCTKKKVEIGFTPVDSGDAEAGTADTPAEQVNGRDGCVGPVACEAGQCGTITNVCDGGVIRCPACQSGFLCEGNRCIPMPDSGCPGCILDNTCYGPGQLNPTNRCELCSPAASAAAWTANEGALCDDGKYCFESDKCVGNGCAGTARDCNDKCSCTDDTCSEEKQRCVNQSNCGAKRVCDCTDNRCKQVCADSQCTIDQVCYNGGVSNPTNECQICDVGKSKTAWTARVGFACGAASSDACAGQNTCNVYGMCVSNPTKAGTPCGDPSDTECSDPDSCDGQGKCSPNHSGTDVACGGAPGVCEEQRYCNGSGACGDKKFKRGGKCAEATDCAGTSYCDILGLGWCMPTFYSSEGTACGDRDLGLCENADTCDGAGNCIDHGFRASGTTCGTSDKKCHTKECDDLHACNEVHVKNDTPCGTSTDCSVWQCQDGDCIQKFLGGEKVCQESDNKCKLLTTCNGTNASCPYQYAQADTLCGTNNTCVTNRCDAVGNCITTEKGNGASCELEGGGQGICSSNTCVPPSGSGGAGGTG
jgi:hypothetical protein